jgi:hypothetical protein
MDEHLVGYLLESLDEPCKRQVEAYLHGSPEARRKLTLLKKALAPLAADRDDGVPPPGLAARTLGKIAQTAGRDLPRAPREPAAAAASATSWWRRADVLVAASLLLLLFAAASPLIYHWHRQRATIECQENLRQFFVALATYHDQKRAYPHLTREAPRNVAGLLVPLLADAGVLPPSFSVRCPGMGPHLGCSFTLQAVRSFSEEEFQAQAPNLAPCYAFGLGFRDPAGDYHEPWQTPASAWPIVADRPPSEGAPGNSINHGGAGQNVLFLDGHFRFMPGRTIAGDDIFLNRANCVAAGVDRQDIVIGCSTARP